MAKHFELDIADNSFTFTRNSRDRRRGRPRRDLRRPDQRSPPSVSTPPASSTPTRASSRRADFRSLKAIDLDLRPIYHCTETAVRAHVFICMLAAYLVWHLRQAWAPLCFTDEHPPDRADPVAPARRSPQAPQSLTPTHADDQPVHSLATLLDELATLTRNQLRTGDTTIEILATPTPLQRQAFELIGTTVPYQLT